MQEIYAMEGRGRGPRQTSLRLERPGQDTGAIHAVDRVGAV